jgi:hypothetical protein
MVWAEDPETGQVALKEVVETYILWASKIPYRRKSIEELDLGGHKILLADKVFEKSNRQGRQKNKKNNQNPFHDTTKKADSVCKIVILRSGHFFRRDANHPNFVWLGIRRVYRPTNFCAKRSPLMMRFAQVGFGRRGGVWPLIRGSGQTLLKAKHISVWF